MALLRGLEALEAGQFTLVLTQLQGRLDLSAEELAILGQAELALSHYPEAELHLLRPHLAGVARATVSYGAVLLQTGRVSAAKLHLEASVDRLEVQWDAEIRHLLAEVHLAEGDNHSAAEQAEGAARLLLARDYEQRAATPLVTMAMACARQGDLFRAEAALMIALNILPDVPDPSARALALATLGWIQGVTGRAEMAFQSLQLAQRLNSLSQQSEVSRKIAAIRADLSRWQMDGEGEHRAVDELTASLPPGGSGHLWWPWVHQRRAHMAVRERRWADAFESLGRVPSGLDTSLTRGLLLLEMDEVEEARQVLTAALEDGPSVTGPVAASLAATIARTCRSHEEAAPHVRRALEEIIATPFLSAAQSPLAMIESFLSVSKAPLAPGLQARLVAARQHLQPPVQQPVVKIRTLGRPEVSFRGAATKASAALLAALKLGGELDRAALQLRLYPDRSASAAESAVKQDIFRTRKALGAQSILSSGPHHNKQYTLAPSLNWQLDAEDVLVGAMQLDATRVFGEMNGLFLPHLDSDWQREIQGRIDRAVEAMVPAILTIYQKEGLRLNMRHVVAQFGKCYPDHPRLQEFNQRVTEGDETEILVT